MAPEQRDRLLQLAEQITMEKDFGKFEELARELARMLASEGYGPKQGALTPSADACH